MRPIAAIHWACDDGSNDTATVMLRLTARTISVALLMMPTVAHACMPSSIAFRSGSARLNSEGLAEVAYVVEEFRARRTVTVRLTAQTDGSDANAQMSHRRAQAVRAALVRHGIPLRAITIETRIGAGAIIGGEGYAHRVVIEVGSAPATSMADPGGSC